MSDVAEEIQMDDSKMDDILKAWKSKSLNSKLTERYKIEFDKFKEDRQDQFKKKDMKQTQNEKVTSQFKNQLLPQPKFVKINQEIFCLYLYKCLVIFKFLSESEKEFFKPKENQSAKTFYSFTHFFEENVKFVIGNNSAFIYVGLENELHTLKLEYKKQMGEENGKYKQYNPIKEQDRKIIPKIKGISFIRELKDEIEVPLLVVVTNDKIIKMKINPTKDERYLEESQILFAKKEDQANFKQINTIQIICENNVYLYLFGTKEGVKREMNEKSEEKQRKCECLYLVKFSLESLADKSTRPILYPIDHVFETGIFNKSKIYQSGPSVFVISLFEEIIVVKYHFERYVVWDNISLAPSKTNEKKGQLILADKIVMVYTENSEIYAHNIYFSLKESKLKYPRIDNFKGTANEDQILYDAIVLEYEQGSYMKVLFYFKQLEVSTPNNRFAVYKDEKTQGENKSFIFYIRCIQQDSPLAKLAELFRGKKTPQQISQFVQRFNISEIDKSKCEWSVSEKTQKDIEGLLLEIKDNEYIQNQLTTILKSSPHDLKFLSRIQKKQIERYKKMLILKLLKYTQKSSHQKTKKITSAIQEKGENTKKSFSKKQVEQIKQIIKWVMESIMFEKKLLYSKNFLQFMEYDFIEIGKLKAASLKQQIKLLSCKGFQKRLLYFLNSFKYMILDKFEDIFEFLIENKTEDEVEKFFKDNFPFILPKFKQKVQVFKQKNKAGNQRQKMGRQRKFSFAMPKLPLVIEKKTVQLDRRQSDSQGESFDQNEATLKKNKEEPGRMQKKIEAKEDENEKKKQECELWVNKFNSAEEMKKIQTIESFEKEINLEITIKQQEMQSKGQYNNGLKGPEAINQFSRILKEFIQEDWFRNNKSKQHSIIESDIPILKKKMKYFKRIGVFHLLIKFFYTKIASGIYTSSKIDYVLVNFKKAGLIPESFQQNILARREIYKKIQQKKKPEVGLPLLQKFLIEEETDYFDYLFRHYREMLLTQIKGVYDTILVGWFKQIFKIYLGSSKIQLTEVIKFLQFFEGNSNVDIRMDVFTCIKNLLQVNDKPNTQFFVDRLMELEILKKQGNSHNGIDQLIDEAKIAFGCYFYSFFEMFSVNSTYKQLISQTFKKDYEECGIIKTILVKYCNQDYIKNLSNGSEDEEEQGLLRLDPSFGLEPVQSILVDNPLDFFGILLYLIDTLRFEIPSEVVFDKFLELQLNCQKYMSIVKFISDFRQSIGQESEDYEESFNDSNERVETKIYFLLKAFYSQSDFTIQERLIDNILVWVRKKYKSIFSETTFSFTFNCHKAFSLIKDTFERVVDELNIESPELLREKSFLAMLQSIKEIESSLLKYVLQRRFQNFNENYHEEHSPLLNQISPFIFMMRLLNQIPKDKFDEQNSTIIVKQIYLFQCIYEKFASASKYGLTINQNNNEETGLSRFYVQLAMRLIADKQFSYCQHVLTTKCILKDSFYQFLALIKPNQNKPSEESFKKFLRDFIQVNHEKNQAKMFSNFLLENTILELQGGHSQQLDNENDKQSAHFIIDKQKTGKQSELRDAIETRRKSKIQTTLAVIKENQVSNIKAKKPTPSSVEFSSYTFSKIIFLTLIESHRVEEAYYFLVRNKMMSVRATSNELVMHKDTTKSHALISIYLKCLGGFLCEQFYPTFAFYKSKHQILLNQYERKDIIKDINIALSRMKEMICEQRLKLTQQSERQLNQSSKIFDKVISQFFDKKLTPQLEAKSQELMEKDERGKLDQLQAKKAQQIKEQFRKDYMRSLQDHLSELKELYEIYMESISLDPKIKLNEQQVKEGKSQLENLNRLISPNEIDRLNRERNFPVSPRFENLKESGKGQMGFNFNPTDLKKSSVPYQQKQLEEERRKIKQNPKFVELQKQINMQVKSTKILSQQYEEEQNPVIKATAEAREKNIKKYNQLKQKQKYEIDSAKESYRSQTSSRVQQILEDIKLRKSKIIDKSDAKSKYSKIELQQSEGQRSRKESFAIAPKLTNLISPPHLEIQIPKEKSESVTSNSIDQSKKYEVKVRGVDGNVKNIFMPITMSKEDKQVSSRVSLESRDILQAPKINKIGNAGSENESEDKRTLKAKPNVKITIDEIRKLFAEKEPQCLKYVEKLEIVKNNPQVGLQITKNIYSSVNNFEVFIRYIGFLLQNFPPYKEVLEEKALKIAVQAMGIQHKINLKELFPIELFTKVVEMNQKQYYKTAYEMMRASLMKILGRPETNIHGMAILFRFGFGSENTYYHRVYEDYIRVLLKDYCENNYQEKKLFSLAEKLRSLYGNINGENRQYKFEQLFREISQEPKRKVLAKQMIKILERRSQMLTGEKQTDLREVLARLS